MILKLRPEMAFESNRVILTGCTLPLEVTWYGLTNFVYNPPSFKKVIYTLAMIVLN